MPRCSWRWAFGINIPLGIIIVIGVLMTVSESKDAAETRRRDLFGAFVSIVASASLVFALAVVAGVGFVFWGRARPRRGLSTMLALDLFAVPSFRNGNIAAMIVSLGEFRNRISPVAIVRVGLAAEIIGVVGLGFVIAPDTEWGVLVPFLFIYGFGVGLATAQLTGVVLRDVPVEQSGQGSGTQSTARQIGAALGIAILGTVLFSTASASPDASLTEQGVPAAQREQGVNGVVDSAGAGIAGLAAEPATVPLADAAKTAFSDGTRYAAFSAAAFLSLGFLATLSLGSGRREQEQSAALQHHV